MASSPLDHLGRALAGALSGLAAVGDEARRRVDGARDAVAGAVANAQQKQSAAMVATQRAAAAAAAAAAAKKTKKKAVKR